MKSSWGHIRTPCKWEDGCHNQNEAELSIYERANGEDVAEAIAAYEHENDHESYVKGGTVIILEPAEFAGTYSIETDWSPSFSATQVK